MIKYDADSVYIHVKDAAKLSVDILDKSYKNRCLTLTGAQSIKIKNLFNILEEIYGEKIKIIFKNKKKTDHYLYTPYSRKIKNIVDQNLTAGEHQLSVNNNDLNGIYLLRCYFDNQQYTNQISFIK